MNTTDTTPIVSMDWLTGPQPQLLSSMASRPKVRETLNGESFNVGELIAGYHAQAVGQYKNFVYVALSNGILFSTKENNDVPGKLWIYDLLTNTGRVMVLPMGGYPHPCNIQVVGDYMVIAMESEYGIKQSLGIEGRAKQSIIVIYDVASDPLDPKEVNRIQNHRENCGGAGLAFHPGMERWYLLAEHDTRYILYTSTSPDLRDCDWELTPFEYRRFGTGAGSNLITAADGSIWGLYFEDGKEGLPSEYIWSTVGNVVRLFKVVEADGTPVPQITTLKQYTDVGSPQVKGLGELLNNRPSMRFGAGLTQDGDKLELITCQRNMESEFEISRTTLSLEEHNHYLMVVNLCSEKTRIYGEYGNTGPFNSGIIGITNSWEQILPSPVSYQVEYDNSVEIFGFSPLGETWEKTAGASSGSINAPLGLLSIKDPDGILGWGKTPGCVKHDFITEIDVPEFLRTNAVLRPGEFIVSNQYRLKLTADGILEFKNTDNNDVIWSETASRSDVFATVDVDHGFCLKAGTPEAPGEVVWANGCGSEQSFLIVQRDDGNLCQYNGSPWAKAGYLWSVIR